MKIIGNSRAKVEVISSDLNYLVKKTCGGPDAMRLVKQIVKQENFQYSHGVRTPFLVSMYVDNEFCEATMEYVSGLDFVTYTNQCNCGDFEDTVNKISAMVGREFEDSNYTKFPKEKWMEKINSVIEDSKNAGLSDEFLAMVKKFLIDFVPENIRVGNCHGDLTFSNVIIERDGTICLFDFLDPPISTPYEDVSKLMQDAEFFWSLRKYQGTCDETRVRIMWSHAKKLILENLKDFLDSRVLAMFQVMSLIRIIPYTKEETTIEYLVECILRKIHETDSTLRR